MKFMISSITKDGRNYSSCALHDSLKGSDYEKYMALKVGECAIEVEEWEGIFENTSGYTVITRIE